MVSLIRNSTCKPPVRQTLKKSMLKVGASYKKRYTHKAHTFSFFSPKLNLSIVDIFIKSFCFEG